MEVCVFDDLTIDKDTKVECDLKVTGKIFVKSGISLIVKGDIYCTEIEVEENGLAKCRFLNTDKIKTEQI